jgi:acyl-CoA reductase-like NAD-dependent aldehyde dehydrogenase
MNYKMYINGCWAEARSGQRWTVVNPATEEPVEDVPFGDAVLRRTADLIRSRLDVLAPIMTPECGKPLGESRRRTRRSTGWWSETASKPG